jgi:UDP-glucose 4-epimerase
MKTVLVTGACGLMGQHICSGLLKKGNAVIAVDREEGHYNDDKENYTFIQAEPNDSSTYADIFSNNKIDTVVHAACCVDNDFGPIITDKEMKISASCDKFIYSYAFNAGVTKFILISTHQVYDFPKTREPIREDDMLKPVTNYAVMKLNSEKAFAEEFGRRKEVIGAILRPAPIYTLSFYDNLVSKITDSKGTHFVYGTGQYGFQFCCLHNLVDFILCFVKNADDATYTGIYNVSDKLLITASAIINFMRANHRIGAVLQKNQSVDSITSIFRKLGNKEEKTNYRYLDMNTIMNNNMLDNNKAAKLLSFRWDINNTK